MKVWLNLLPWREKNFRRRRRQTVQLLSLWLGGILLIWSGLFYLNRQVRQEVQQYRQSLQQQQEQLAELIQQNHRLRVIYQPQQQSAIAGKRVVLSLRLLSELPFTQGRLTAFSLKPQKIQLTGIAAEQREFDHLNQFLVALPQPHQLRLQDFSPQSEGGLLHFQFELLLQEEEHE